jgi:hypothetical protein
VFSFHWLNLCPFDRFHFDKLFNYCCECYMCSFVGFNVQWWRFNETRRRFYWHVIFDVESWTGSFTLLPSEKNLVCSNWMHFFTAEDVGKWVDGFQSFGHYKGFINWNLPIFQISAQPCWLISSAITSLMYTRAWYYQLIWAKCDI